MTPEGARAPDPGAWGIAPGHHHVRGHWVPAPRLGVEAALAAMGADGPGPPPTPTWVVRASDGLEVPFPATLETEDGRAVPVHGRVDDPPLGYHRIAPDDGSPAIRLIVSPGRCPLPERSWGWAAQLYATRSRESWGMGDLADLRRLARWSASSTGAGMLLVNPVHAVAPTPEQQSSPYFPASRRWRNPIYLRIEEVPGAERLGARLDELAAGGRALNGERRIDRQAVWARKRTALAEIWAAAGPGRDCEAWVAAQGPGLTGFATWSALTDVHGHDWRSWPPVLRHPSDPGVSEFAASHADAVRFHSWLQWLMSRQWADAAAAGPAIVTDLAIGADPAGADAWQWQDVLAAGVTVGAPPDEFSPGGQDWGLPPFDPWRLRGAGYEPFAQIVRAAVAGGGGIRVDHVAGLFRLFWVPEGATAGDGVYVRYPWRDLLNVLALEADRAGAFVVGEDLGTVEDEARQALAAWQVLSYRLAWFEDRPPSEWPELALAAVTTHDLPTVAGVWTGADLAARQQLGLTVDEEAERGLRARLEALCGPSDPGVAGVVRCAYGAVASSPCRLASATLDDALGVEERPNLPGTVDEWPNWSIALPMPLEEIEEDAGVQGVAEAMRRGGR